MDGFFDYFSRLLHRLGSFVEHGLGGLFRGLGGLFRGLGRRVSWPFKVVENLFGSLFEFLAWWWRERRLINFVYGLPAVLVFSVVGYFFVVGATQSDSLVAQNYILAAKKAQAENKFVDAKLLYERGLLLNPLDTSSRFELAVVAQRLKDFPRFITLLHELAPETRPNLQKAHLLKAQWYFELGKIDPAKNNLGEQQLKLVLTIDPRNEYAHSILGDISYQRQQWQEAIAHYSLIQGVDASRRILVARAYQESGNSEQATLVAERARAVFLQILDQNPADLETRLLLADACMFLKRHQEAVFALQEAAKRSTDARLTFLLARALLAWSDDVPESNPESKSQRFDLITTSFLLNPSDLATFDRMLKLLGGTGEVETKGREFLLKSITEGKSPGVCHLLLGTVAYNRKNLNESKFHLERAYKLIPDAGIVANNFAYLLCFGEDPNPDKALSLINEVIVREPNVGSFRDTRGQILVKMGRFTEAIDDLEFAIAANPNGVSSHETIAAAYENLNLADLAAEHRQRANKLRDRETQEQ